MKEFNKWWENKIFVKRINKSLSPNDYFDHMSPYNVGEHIWKAALEWALEQEDWIGPDDGGSWGIDMYAIEEELEDERV